MSALLLFDLDGTILDSVPMIIDSLRWTTQTQLGLTLDDATLRAGVGTALKDQLAAHARRAGIEPSPARVAALVSAYLEHNHATHDARIKVFDGILEALEVLRARGHAMAIVTSKARQISQRGLEITGAARFFEALIAYEDTAQHKPDPAPLHLALKRLGREASEAIYIGDAIHDIEAGKAAGLRTLGAGWGAPDLTILMSAAPDLLLNDPRDLITAPL
ncbi:HAD-IA family hydrolase [Myxococcota bacterium]|nr:HAD-IA family hydrolase [Myxococcota bacterium]MBU1429934.1 HAD-IA family hydrolase [Myxococcota bacterium]MBU1897563.1 HAD-IA family hydrolase [Myxococcota bacterium]